MATTDEVFMGATDIVYFGAGVFGVRTAEHPRLRRWAQGPGTDWTEVVR